MSLVFKASEKLKIFQKDRQAFAVSSNKNQTKPSKSNQTKLIDCLKYF